MTVKENKTFIPQSGMIFETGDGKFGLVIDVNGVLYFTSRALGVS